MKVEEITVEEFMQIIEKKLALLIKQEAREELEKAERRRGRMKKMGARDSEEILSAYYSERR